MHFFTAFSKPSGMNPENFNLIIMDEKEARIWIKLEWKALRKAIDSEGEEQILCNQGCTYLQGFKPGIISQVR